MAHLSVNVTFQFVGDEFKHAWYFNRFRCDPLGESTLVTTALVTDGGGLPAVNGFVISNRDLEMTKGRSEEYFSEVSAEFDSADGAVSTLSVAPSRVYPINHINLSRIDEVGEICLYRYTMKTLLSLAKKPEKGERAVGRALDTKNVPCYPVVMFRSDIRVQVALLKELFSR